MLEAMRDARGGEEQIARRERLARVAADELACALRDHIDLIARVRLLRIMPARRVELNLQSAMREQENGALALRRGQALQCLSQSDLARAHPLSVLLRRVRVGVICAGRVR